MVMYKEIKTTGDGVSKYVLALRYSLQKWADGSKSVSVPRSSSFFVHQVQS